MTRTQERCLICFIIMMVFGVVQLHFIMTGHSGRSRLSPCPSRPGVHWVRDPYNCSAYFICVAFLPIQMPGCPDSFVWSVSGRNCVPVDSRWNDCGHVLPPPPPRPPLPTDNSAVHEQNWMTSSNRMGALVDLQDSEAARRKSLQRLLPNHPCALSEELTYLPHPSRCHWFYNCSAPVTDRSATGADEDGWGPLTEECPYPKLFSLTTRTCQPYTKVDCGMRTLRLDPCEYRQLHCRNAHCPPCNVRYGSCVGLDNGLQPFPNREWTPLHLVCRDQRALRQLNCPREKPVFSPETKRCESLLDIPRMHGGFQPSCEGRHDGWYSDDTGRCDVFYRCFNYMIQGRFQCPSGTFFHPESQSCRRKGDRGLSVLCGHHLTAARTSPRLSRALCHSMEDGLYADPYGRCSLYYECKQSELKSFHSCRFGSYNPRSQRCQSTVSDVPAPCGHQPNPCMDKADGQYADLASNCREFYQCKRNVIIAQRSCRPGTVFSEEKGSCQLPNDTSPPCGLAPTCEGKVDGRYPSPLKGCQFYSICRSEIFMGYRRCSVEEGGFYFNSITGLCDFPQNICAPCGVRVQNCTVSADHV